MKTSAVDMSEFSWVGVPDIFAYSFAYNAYDCFNCASVFCSFLHLPDRLGSDSEKRVIGVQTHLCEDDPIPQSSSHPCSDTFSGIGPPSLPPAFRYGIGEGWSRRRRYRLANQKSRLLQVWGCLQSSVETFYHSWHAFRKRRGAVLNQMRSSLPHERCWINEPWQSTSRRCSYCRKLATPEGSESPE